jgi:metal-responsive CopG/Arc/MetJ family transcriptional regulator
MRGDKVRTEKVSLSISKDTNAQLTVYCEERLMNKSKLVSRLIRDFLDKVTTQQKKHSDNGKPAEGKQEE